MSETLLREATETLEQADLIINEKTIYKAIDELVEKIKEYINDNEVPVLLCVMRGGLMFTSELMKRLQMPVELDYVHVDRYRDKTQGGSLHWHKEPDANLNERLVLLADDIFDEGYTMQELIAYCKAKGAREVKSVVLLKKSLAEKYIDIEPDFVGLECVDRYVFGWGMDYKGYWRNLSDVYAVSRDN